MPYTVHQLAKLAGVTSRTLRYYDKVGLLSPAHLGRNGYRYYGEDELVRLQQILFFRELDFPLEDIKAMIDSPSFDRIESLKYQKGLLALKRQRLDGIMKTIDNTITTMTNDEKPTEKDMYGSLSTEKIEEYKKEAKERWGNTDAYKQSQERAKKFTKADWDVMSKKTDANLRAMVALMEAGKAADSAEVIAEVANHRAGINRFYDCTDEIYRGLADMYVADDRFAEFYRKYHADLPQFLSNAMKASCAK